MTSIRRLQIVAVMLAVAVAVTSTRVWGDSGKGRELKPLDGGNKTLPPDPKKGGDDDVSLELASMKFAAGGVVTYRTKDNEHLFAAQLKAKLPAAAARPRDVLVLVDSSASQVGAPWTASVALVEALANAAGKDDRLLVSTVNTPQATRDLTNGFRAASSEQVKDAIKALRDETPLGDTDLKNGLKNGLQKFDGDAHRQKVVLFIGDGYSIHNPITSSDLVKLAADFVKDEAAFFPVPIGPRIDSQNIHGLTNSTGGLVVRIDAKDKPQDTAKRLLEAFAAPILYPTEFKLPAEVKEFCPVKLPPLRSDAATLLVGSGKLPVELKVQVEGLIAGKKTKVELVEQVAEPELDNFFLVGMFHQWRKAKDQPALLRADRALAFAHDTDQMRRAELLEQARLAMATEQFAAAAKLFDQAKRLDPFDPEAEGGFKVAKAIQEGKLNKDELKKQIEKDNRKGAIIEKGKDGKPVVKKDQFKNLVAQAKEIMDKQGGNENPPEVAPPQDDKNLLRDNQARKAIEEQRINQIVDDSLRQARRMVKTDPDQAHDILKRMLAGIRDNADLAPEFRQGQLTRLESALRTVDAEGIRIRREQDDNLKRLAEARARFEREEKLRADEDRTRERIRSYSGLMQQARYEDALRAHIDLRNDLVDAGMPVPAAVTAGGNMALTAHHVREMRELKRVREERMLMTMMQVERSAVPFPDEPPIHFPPTATWKQLYELRKDRYESSGLADDNPISRRKHKALMEKMSKPVSVDGFPANTKLEEALDFLQTRFGVTLLIDTDAFTEKGLPEVEKSDVRLPKLVQVSFSTVLRMLLAPIGGTYILRGGDFVEITTAERQAAEKVVRAYYVADLVIPIPDSVNQNAINQTAQNMILGGFQSVNGGFNIGIGGGLNLGAGGFNLGAGGFNLGVGGFNLGVGGFNVGIGGLNVGIGAGPVGAGGLNGFAGVAGFGGLNANGAGQGGALGGQFGIQAGDTSQLLIQLIVQTIGRRDDWGQIPVDQGMMGQLGMVGMAGAAGFGAGIGGLPPVDPNLMAGDPNTAGNLGYYPPARALIVKNTSRIYHRLDGGLLGTNRAPPPVALGDKPPRDGLLAVGAKKDKDKVAVAGNNDKVKDKDKKEPKPVDPKKVGWQETLAKGGSARDPGMIIATADFLVENGKFDHAAEFLKANIRESVVVRPWVYEALAVAMTEAKYSTNDIERAHLSLVDIEPTDAAGYLKASKAMGDLKKYDRAVAFCRQASVLDPNAPQPYAEALIYAQLSKDSSAMEWASSNLLQRDWPVDNKELHGRATDQFKTLAKILETEKRNLEAQKLTSAVEDARRRDLVIKLSWQGSADLDLEVKEPIGSVCSFAQRQTPGGGTFSGDTLLDMAADVKSENYVACEAYSGDYEITVRKVWGTPTGSKAMLQVVQNSGSKDEKVLLREAVVLDRSKTVKVSLDKGRRTSAAVVSSMSTQKTPEKEREAGISPETSIFNRLRAAADPSIAQQGGRGAGSGVVYGMGTPVEKKIPPKPSDITFAGQPAVNNKLSSFVDNALDVTTKVKVAADGKSAKIQLSPVFQGLDRIGNGPSYNNPAIPGAAR